MPFNQKEYARKHYQENKEKYIQRAQESFVRNGKEAKKKEVEQQRIRRATNPEKHKNNSRKNWLRYKYGLTVEDYAQLLEEQDGNCYLCERPPQDGEILFVDHCHSTDKIRGLVHRNCNSLIGFAKDDPEMIFIIARNLACKQV